MPHDNLSLPIIPHEWIPEVHCCGCLIMENLGEISDMTCNECGAGVRSLSFAEAESALAQVANIRIASTAPCRHCAKMNLILGFDSIAAFTCRHCGAANSTFVQ